MSLINSRCGNDPQNQEILPIREESDLSESYVAGSGNVVEDAMKQSSNLSINIPHKSCPFNWIDIYKELDIDVSKRKSKLYYEKLKQLILSRDDENKNEKIEFISAISQNDYKTLQNIISKKEHY
jgi:hypothetical protein